MTWNISAFFPNMLIKLCVRIITVGFSVRMASEISWRILFYFRYRQISFWKKFESSSASIIATQARLSTNCIFWRMWDWFLLVRFVLILIYCIWWQYVYSISYTYNRIWASQKIHYWLEMALTCKVPRYSKSYKNVDNILSNSSNRFHHFPNNAGRLFKLFLGEEKVIFLVPKSTNDFSTLIELAKKINSGLFRPFWSRDVMDPSFDIIISVNDEFNSHSIHKASETKNALINLFLLSICHLCLLIQPTTTLDLELDRWFR